MIIKPRPVVKKPVKVEETKPLPKEEVKVEEDTISKYLDDEN